ncbi:MAG: outer membrane beta-barrel protein [Saprospiraceae bacterium]
MKRLLISLSLFLCFYFSYSQSTNFNIKGVLEDTLGNPLIYSTVLLLDPDSTMVDFTRSELDGSFKFKDVSHGQYLIKSTFVGFIPRHTKVSSIDKKNVDLGVIIMNEMAAELMEIVIKAAKAQIKMRGDTIEYDVSTFKVPIGSTVEDLIRKLPGMEVDLDGTMRSDGKDVTEVTVDGKSFFGNNPKAATQNLPSESISKVQVFDKKSEEEEITGATSQSQEKTMNLQLKEDYKSGGFGRVIGGIGNEDRKELKGNFNRFNEKIQFSVVGVGNNTGRNGLSWDDYQDFLGSQSFNFDSNLEYGFGGGGHRFFFFGGGGNSLESSLQSIFFQGRQNSGFPENYNGGLNFNYDHNKLKITSVYYYNQAGLTSNTKTERDRFFQNFVQNEEVESDKHDISKGHRGEFTIEAELDSLHSFKVEFNSAIINRKKIYNGVSDLFRNNTLQNKGQVNNINLQSGHLGNGAIIFRKKFKKKGRRIGMNVSYLFTHLQDDSGQNSTTTFFDENGLMDSEVKLDQFNANIGDKTVFRANALFVEPLSKRLFFQSFLNHSQRKETGEREVLDRGDSSGDRVNEFLSRSTENNIDMNRIGTLLRYSHEGVNITTGLAYQKFNLSGSYRSVNESLFSGTVDRDFANIIPHIAVNYSPGRNMYLSLSYTRTATEPQIQELQPIVDNANPLFITEGNPGLTPEIGNNINGYMSRTFPASGIRLSVNGRFTIFDNFIGREETIDLQGITISKSINIEDGVQGNINFSINLPIIQNRFTTRWRFNTNISNLPAIVNDVRNNTDVVTLNPSLTISYTPNNDILLSINGFYRKSNTSYNINSSQDQTVVNQGFGMEFNAKLIAGFYFASRLDYNKFTNDRFQQNLSVPILNASIYRQFLKGNRAELRLAIYDAFDENVSLQQGTYGNGISQSLTNALGRYGMLSFTYNIKGLKTGVSKRRRFH